MFQINKTLFGYFPLSLLILGAFIIMTSPSNASEIEEVFKKNGVVPDVIQTAPTELLQVYTFISISIVCILYLGNLFI